MFDIMHDQAAGLRAVAPPAGIRLVPVVLSRDADAAFDVVWILGAGLSAMGRNVVALDATSREQPNRPGLAQMLQSNAQPGGGADAPAWQILPSQSGLSSLMHTAQTEGATASLNRLAAAFTVDTIVLVLAPKEWLSVLFEESQARPLVPFSLEASGVVDAYSAVKVLFQAGGLQPVLMPVPSAVPDALVAQGVGLWIGFQAFINIGVNLGALPTKGLTLPLMSYGGSAILLELVALAIVLRVDHENRLLMKGGRS